jgi:hypothetical protein
MQRSIAALRTKRAALEGRKIAWWQARSRARRPARPGDRRGRRDHPPVSDAQAPSTRQAGRRPQRTDPHALVVCVGVCGQRGVSRRSQNSGGCWMPRGRTASSWLSGSSFWRPAVRPAAAASTPSGCSRGLRTTARPPAHVSRRGLAERAAASNRLRACARRRPHGGSGGRTEVDVQEHVAVCWRRFVRAPATRWNS